MYYENNLSHRLRILSSTAKRYIQDGKVDKIVDVRTDLEWKMGHHPKAIHIPVSEIEEKANKKLKKNESILI